MKAVLNERGKGAIREAIKTGEMDLLAIPELRPFMKDYVRNIEKMGEICRKSYERKGKIYPVEPITAPIPVGDRALRVALIMALHSGTLDITEWVDEAKKINKKDLFLELMKEVGQGSSGGSY
ncbi:MAG: hypothetical protein WC319_09260 [Candidatus Paceibacterota bacterium]|jgi:hypothetical protein